MSFNTTATLLDKQVIFTKYREKSTPIKYSWMLLKFKFNHYLSKQLPWIKNCHKSSFHALRWRMYQIINKLFWITGWRGVVDAIQFKRYFRQDILLWNVSILLASLTVVHSLDRCMWQRAYLVFALLSRTEYILSFFYIHSVTIINNFARLNISDGKWINKILLRSSENHNYHRRQTQELGTLFLHYKRKKNISIGALPV